MIYTVTFNPSLDYVIGGGKIGTWKNQPDNERKHLPRR